MPTFSYKALDAQGKTTSGTVTAAGRAAAIEQVVQRGLFPVDLSVAEGGRASQASPTWWRSAHPPRHAAESFTRELSHLLQAGVPLSRALQVLAREAAHPVARAQWNRVRQDVTDGASLADAMAHLPRTFSPVHVAMVRAGEQGGFLDVVLGQIAEFRARERDLMGRVKAAAVYPAILTVLLVVVVIFLLTYFIPRFQGIFDEFGAALPLLTRVIVAASRAVSDYGLVLLGAGVAIALAVWRWRSSEAGRQQIERLTLSLPGVGTVAARFALVRFCRMLGTLLGAGVPLVSALRTARDALGNRTLHETVNHAIERVQAGEPLASSLAQCPRLFPPSVVEMIAVAEQTSRLDTELTRLAVAYEADLDRRLRMLVSVVEPLLLMVMAAVVGAIVVGMLLPVFTLQDLIQ